MAWITPTSDDVIKSFTDRERDAIEDVKGDTTLDDILGYVVEEIRGYCLTIGPVGAAGTIPPQLKQVAVTRARHELMVSVPDRGMMTEARAQANKDALRILENVAAGKFAIEAPATTGSETGNSPTLPATTARTRDFERSDMDGV